MDVHNENENLFFELRDPERNISVRVKNASNELKQESINFRYLQIYTPI